MSRIVLKIAAQPQDWVLAIEPWAFAYSIKAGDSVIIDAPALSPVSEWELSPAGLEDGVWTIGAPPDDYEDLKVLVGTARKPATSI